MAASAEVRFLSGLDEIAAQDWDALRPDDNPFLAHAFLYGLERHGCIRTELGWLPWHAVLLEAGRAVAAAPCYLKDNSHGEFVFDWSWAEAYQRHGLDYYPKLLVAVPYSPVTGPRLLGAPAQRQVLLQALAQACAQHRLSSAHVNFVSEEARTDFDTGTWLPRHDWQFHWHNRGYRDFDDFLAALKPKKRKNLRQERARVAAQGVSLQTLHGDELDEADWRFVHACYKETFAGKGNYPALTEAFLRHLGQAMPRNLVVFLAHQHGERVAMALCLRSRDTLYGRYWGCTREIPGLHFEACYYQGLEYCLREGLQRFEPGAQGEHKIARGFLPTPTHSFHHVAQPPFRDAIRRALQAEELHWQRNGEYFCAQSPYADAGTSDDAGAEA